MRHTVKTDARLSAAGGFGGRKERCNEENELLYIKEAVTPLSETSKQDIRPINAFHGNGTIADNLAAIVPVLATPVRCLSPLASVICDHAALAGEKGAISIGVRKIATVETGRRHLARCAWQVEVDFGGGGDASGAPKTSRAACAWNT